MLKASDSLLACARYTKQSRTGSRNPKLQAGKGKPKQNENSKISLFFLTQKCMIKEENDIFQGDFFKIYLLIITLNNYIYNTTKKTL